MLTKDIRAKHPGWEIWKDGYVRSALAILIIFLLHSCQPTHSTTIRGHGSPRSSYTTRTGLTTRCPDGETPGESPQQMSDRVDSVIAKIRAIHQEVRITCFKPSPKLSRIDNKAEDVASCPEEADHADVMIFSHGHFTRCFIARWCDFPINAGYHFSADPGCVS